MPAAPTFPAESGKLLTALSSSPSAEKREMAALYLGSYSRSGDMSVLHGLMNAALGDAVPSVRSASLRALIQLNNRSAPVLTIVQAMRNDDDPLVRSEADRAFKILTQTEITATNTRNGVR
jgi:HEAT repeat protein